MRKLRLREVVSTYHWLTCSCFILFKKKFLFVFKVSIEFVTILFLFYVLDFWSQGRWDLSSPTVDLTYSPCIGRRSLNHWITREVLFIFLSPSRGLPRWLSGKESACHCRKCGRHGFNPWVRKISWGKKWQPTPVFLLGKFRGQRSLGGCAPWGCRVGGD